jgi:hypothetical protein
MTIRIAIEVFASQLELAYYLPAQDKELSELYMCRINDIRKIMKVIE